MSISKWNVVQFNGVSILLLTMFTHFTFIDKEKTEKKCPMLINIDVSCPPSLFSTTKDVTTHLQQSFAHSFPLLDQWHLSSLISHLSSHLSLNIVEHELCSFGNPPDLCDIGNEEREKRCDSAPMWCCRSWKTIEFVNWNPLDNNCKWNEMSSKTDLRGWNTLKITRRSQNVSKSMLNSNCFVDKKRWHWRIPIWLAKESSIVPGISSFLFIWFRWEMINDKWIRPMVVVFSSIDVNKHFVQRQNFFILIKTISRRKHLKEKGGGGVRQDINDEISPFVLRRTME